MSWSWPSGILSLSGGRISVSNSDEVATHQDYRNRKVNDEESTTLQYDYEQVNDDKVSTLQHLEQEIGEVREQNENQENNKISIKGLENSSHNRQRKLKSKVWEEFTKYRGEDGKQWALCKHCKREFDGSSKKGTTHLRNHLERCRVKRNGDNSIKTSDLTIPVVIKEKSVIDIISHNLDAIEMATRHWNPSVLNSRKVDILRVYWEEREKLCGFLNKLSGRISITIEWLRGWYFLMVHCINDSWELTRKIISVQDAKFRYAIFLATLKDSCLEWKINGNVCSIVTIGDVTSQSGQYLFDCWARTITGDNDIEGINGWVSKRGSLPFCGQLLAVGGLVDILQTCINDIAIWACEALGIRRCFDYFQGTPSNERKLQIAVGKAKSMGRKVTCERIPRWTFGFEEFEISVNLKEVFCEIENTDSDFKSINLTKEEWDRATVTYDHLKALHDTACSLSESKYTIANAFFPKVCDIYTKLLLWDRHENYHVRKIALETRKIFVDRYWMKFELILVIAAVLDPRFKMDIVHLWYKEIYGREANAYVQKIIHDFVHVYNKYGKDCSNSKSGNASSSASYKMLDAMGRPCTSSHSVVDDIASPKSELHRYLKEPKFPSVEEFDILVWWRANTANFPTLARMARDYLAIPISRFQLLLVILL